MIARIHRNIGLAAALAVATIHGSAEAAPTYTIQRIGLVNPAPSIDQTNGLPLDTSSFIYSNASGNVVGSLNLFGGSPAFNSAALWYYNGSITIPLGFYDPSDNTVNLTTNVLYKRPTAGTNLGNNNVAQITGNSPGNSRVYNNGYVAGISRRFDSGGNALGADAWIFNGNGATASTKSVAIPIPSTVIVPASSAQSADLSPLGLVASPSGVSSNGGNLAFNVPNQVSGGTGTLETVGGTTTSGQLQAGSHGNAAGQVSLYYNTTGTTWTSTATDAFYYDGSSSKIIGLVEGNNAQSTGSTTGNRFARVNNITRLNDADQVLGYSNYYGGTAVNGAASGIDIWLYEPANATGSGANGTRAIAPSAPAGNVYAVGTTSLTPTYLTNSGIVGAAFQRYASSDAARATTLGQDAFLYDSKVAGPAAWTQVGLTAASNGASSLTTVGYTFFPAANKAGVGGSSIAFINTSYAPPVNEKGQAVGLSIRTIATGTGTTGAALGRDAWVYYPAAEVPVNAVAGTTRVGLIGTNSSAYETTVTGNQGTTRSSQVIALTATGGVVGDSVRYYNTTSPTSGSISPGSDAWVYDPGRGITSTKQIGLFSNTSTPDPIHEFTLSGAANVGRSSSTTAVGSNGMIGGTSVRYRDASYATTASVSSTGLDAWVYDPITDKTYSVDPTSPTDRTKLFASSITYISDSGVAVGFDSNALSNTGSPTFNYSMFAWYLAFDSATGIKDIPTFQRLFTSVDPTSLSNGDWSNLFAANTTNGGPNLPSTMTADGRIIGLGSINADSPNSLIPFQLTVVPEPTSLGVLLLGATLMAGRKGRNRHS